MNVVYGENGIYGEIVFLVKIVYRTHFSCVCYNVQVVNTTVCSCICDSV